MNWLPSSPDAKWKRSSVAAYKPKRSRGRWQTWLLFFVCFSLWRVLKRLDYETANEPDNFQSRIVPKWRTEEIKFPKRHEHERVALTEKRSEILPSAQIEVRTTSKLLAVQETTSDAESVPAEPNAHTISKSQSNSPAKPEARLPLTNVTPEEEDDAEQQLSRLSLSIHGEPVRSGESPIPEKVKPQPQIEQKSSPVQRFPTYSEFLDESQRADTFPDIVHVTFEEATSEVELEGWEDTWFSEGRYDAESFGLLQEPKIDFIYTWVNGSDQAFADTILPYELNSTMNDPEGVWIAAHKTNRYRDWDELRYTIRSVEKYAKSFRNKIQLLVNSVGEQGIADKVNLDNPAAIHSRQRPLWLKNDAETAEVVQVLSQEDFFVGGEARCLPTFNSLTIENQMHNSKSDTDRFFALSDDMILAKTHAASDIYSPLFGPMMAFKTNSYNTRNPPQDVDAHRFGEKPFLIYTSWLLNRRFGERKRKGQVHFGHSMSRTLAREAMNSFPRPALQSTCQRFRGETGFQLYSWYATFHYTIERHREALLWSYIMIRSDVNNDGYLDWQERQAIMEDFSQGIANEANSTFRQRMFYKVEESLEAAGLAPPLVNRDILWTSLDGPSTIREIDCSEFDVNECMAPGFSTNSSDHTFTNPIFSTSLIFDFMARQHPKCGDCLLKLILNKVERGLSPLLPNKESQQGARATVIKAMKRYHYAIMEPDALFMMITDADQIKQVLLKRILKQKRHVGQLCLNDDVSTNDEGQIEEIRKSMEKLFKGLVPDPSPFERVD